MMNAEQPRLDDVAADQGEPGVSQAIVMWMREQNLAHYPAPGQEDGWGAIDGSGPAIDRSNPANVPETNDFETVSFLLRAIEGTEIAARLLAEAEAGKNFHAPVNAAGTGMLLEPPVEDERHAEETQPENFAGSAPQTPEVAGADEELETASAPEDQPLPAASGKPEPDGIEPPGPSDESDAKNAETAPVAPGATDGAEIAASAIDEGRADAVQGSVQLEPEPADQAESREFELTAEAAPPVVCALPETVAETPPRTQAAAKTARNKAGGSEIATGQKLGAARPAVIQVARSKRQRNSRRLTLFALPMSPEPAPAVPEGEAVPKAEEKAEAEGLALLSATAVATVAEPKIIAAEEQKISVQPEPERAIEQLPVFLAPMFPPVKPVVAQEQPKSVPTILPVFVNSMFPRAEAAASRQPTTADAASLARPGEQDSAGAATPANGTGLAAGVPRKIDLIGERMARAELQFEKWVQGLFKPRDPRRGQRVVDPPLIAYHWIVDTPQALKVVNISSTGLCLVTDYRWSEGNIVSMTLQRTDIEKDEPDSWIAVDFVVIRWCKEGLAGAFLPAPPGKMDAVAGRAENTADKQTLERFVARLSPGVPQ